MIFYMFVYHEHWTCLNLPRKGSLGLLEKSFCLWHEFYEHHKTCKRSVSANIDTVNGMKQKRNQK